MKPLLQFLAPLIGPPVLSSITTKPGRFRSTEPSPYVAHEPRHGAPLRMRPLFIISIAEPCNGDSAYMLCTNAMSSTQRARWGNRSETHLPHWPYCRNAHLGPTTRPCFFSPPRPFVSMSIVLPSSANSF